MHETALQADECLVALCSLVKVPAIACMLPAPLTDETKKALEKISDAGVLAKDAASQLRPFLVHKPVEIVACVIHHAWDDALSTILTKVCTLELRVAMVVSSHGATK